MTLVQAIRGPSSLLRLASDRWLWPWWLRRQGVEFGEGLWLAGCPAVRMRPGGQIRLGSGVKLFSRPGSNPLYLSSPCVFSLVRDRAMIEVGSESALSGTALCAATLIQIGARVLIGAGCKIMDTDFHPLSALARRGDPVGNAETGPVRIGDDVFIGAGVVIVKNAVIGSGSVVGAGAVVTGTFPAGSVLAGNPARVLRELKPGEEQR